MLKPIYKITLSLALISLTFAAGYQWLPAKKTQNLKSQPSHLSDTSVPAIKSGVFRSRLSPTKQKTIGGQTYQCWQEDNSNNELTLLTARYLPTQKIVQKIESTQYLCGKNVATSAEELSNLKNKFKDIVLTHRSVKELNFCEASALHFLIRDVARKSAFNTAPCPI